MSGAPGSSEAEPPAPSGSGAQQPGDGPGASQDGGELSQPRAAFRAALEKIHSEQVLPSGDRLEVAEYANIETAEFAVFDIDADGEEELVFTFSDTYTAAMATYVYSYNAGLDRLMVELWEYPALSFYNTGVVKASASHNHGPAGETLWPFTLYQYEPVADDYRVVAMVDAWDKSLTDFYDQRPFPDGADADGDGVVYYVMYGDYTLEDPIDGPAFQDWYDSWFLGAEEVEIPYMKLTEENIRSIR